MKIIFTVLIFTLFNHKIKCPEVLLSGEGHMELSSNVDISNKYHDNFYQINSFNQLNSQNQFQVILDLIIKIFKSIKTLGMWWEMWGFLSLRNQNQEMCT